MHFLTYVGGVSHMARKHKQLLTDIIRSYGKKANHMAINYLNIRSTIINSNKRNVETRDHESSGTMARKHNMFARNH